jgi:hypothetical protein
MICGSVHAQVMPFGLLQKSTISGLKYTILDQSTNDVPTGTNYNKLTFYNEYIDAGSIDASPFIFRKTTLFTGGILYYGSTEFIYKTQENSFRLTSTSGNNNFISFDLNNLEQNINEGNSTTIPTMTLTSSTGESITFQSEVDSFDLGGGEIYYFYSFREGGIITLDWNNVEWVDIKTRYAKAKTRTFVLKTL